MIPVEAVEAAHRAWREQAAQDGSIFEYNLQAALEAAAPYLLAEGWDEGRLAYSERDMSRDEPLDNPYRISK